MTRPLWPRIRRVWAIAGSTVFVVFTVWSLIALQATPEAKAALGGDDRVTVTRGAHHWIFRPRGAVAPVGLIFFPGGLVDPAAYAPLLRDVAGGGHVVLLVELARRGAFGGADDAIAFPRARAAMAAVPELTRWVAAGHSRGGAVAASLVRAHAGSLAGLVLIGTSHPRDFSLASVALPITQVFGTRDTVADVEKLEANRSNLPAATRRVRIDGGNHSQFGSYGFQPGDWPATISREEQRRITRDALLDALRDPR